MSFDREWASAKEHAANNGELRLAHAHAQAGPGGGGSTGGDVPAGADLSVKEDHLGALGNAAYDLHTRLSTAGRTAETSTADAASLLKAADFRTGAALSTVHADWSSQVDTLLDACGVISDHLHYSAASHAKEERTLKTTFTASQIAGFYK